MARTVALRMLGFATAAVLAAVAARLLTYSLDIDSWFVADALSTVAGWFDASISEGGAVLIGAALLLISTLIALVVLRPERAKLIRLGKGPSGKYYLDPTSLARSLQRSLRKSVHTQILVQAKGRKLVATAPYRSSADPREMVDEMAALMPAELEKRGVPSVKYRVGVGKPAKKRVR